MSDRGLFDDQPSPTPRGGAAARRRGAGGMGEVYRAHDEQLDRDVAIKILAPSIAEEPAARERLLREARAVAALNHPHVCTGTRSVRPRGRSTSRWSGWRVSRSTG